MQCQLILLQGRPSLIAVLLARAFSARSRSRDAAKLVVSELFIATRWLTMLQDQGIDAAWQVIGIFYFAAKRCTGATNLGLSRVAINVVFSVVRPTTIVLFTSLPWPPLWPPSGSIAEKHGCMLRRVGRGDERKNQVGG